MAHPSDAGRGATAVISPPTIPEFISVWGKTPEVDRIQVHWLAGECEAWQQTAVDRIVNLREGTGQPCHMSVTQCRRAGLTGCPARPTVYSERGATSERKARHNLARSRNVVLSPVASPLALAPPPLNSLTKP